MAPMNVIRSHWNRRDFLRAAGITAGAATLSGLVPREVRAATGLKRVVFIQTGNGSILESWRSNGTGTPLVNNGALPALMGPILSPLEAHRSKLLLVDGIDLSSMYISQSTNGRVDGGRLGSGHAGACVLWTGKHGGGKAFPDHGEFPNSPSVDQIINDRIGGGRASLRSTVWERISDPRWVYSFDKSATPLMPEPDPRVVFDTLFKGKLGVATGPTRADERKLRSLDMVRGELQRLRAQFTGADRVRFDQHEQKVAELAAQLSIKPAGTCTATAGDRPTLGAVDKTDLEGMATTHIKTLALALACDVVRVASFSLGVENVWGGDNPGKYVPGFTGDAFHQRSHESNAGATPAIREAAVRAMTSLQKWHAAKVAMLLDELTALGVMDETLVVWGMAMSHGGYHSNRNVPIVIAQGASGPLKTGRYVRYGTYQQTATGGCDGQCGGGADTNESNNNLLISLCHAMGLPDVSQVGEAKWCKPVGLDDRLMK
jgi:hypothetical protein